MKKLVASVISVLALSAPAFAATWTGVISDSMCGKSHAAMTGNGSKMTDSQCTTACVEHGAKYVFVQGDKVLNIANQDFKELKALAGDRVQLSGDLKGDTITVTRIEKAK